MKKRLYRSRDSKFIAGVLGGLAEYFDQDPLVWRLGFIVLLCVTGLMPFALIYLIAWIMIPERPLVEPVAQGDYTDTTKHE